MNTYTNKQGQLFKRDPEKAAANQHYSERPTPIVDLGEPFVSVDDGRDFRRPERRQHSAAKFVSLADAVHDILIVSVSFFSWARRRIHRGYLTTFRLYALM